MAENYINIQLFKMKTFRKQNVHDVQAVINVSGRFINKDVDLIAWTTMLEAYGLISHTEGRALQRKLTVSQGSQQDEFLVFLGEIFDRVSFVDFVNTVYKHGMIDYAEELRQERYGRDVLLRLGSADVPFAPRIQEFYSTMKQNVDNGVFKNAREYLENLTREYKAEIEHSTDQEKRQYFAEKLVAIYVLKLPQYTTFPERKALLEDMNKTFHREKGKHGDEDNNQPAVDSNSADIVYASKMAITVALSGDFTKARQYAEKAEHSGSLYKSSLARTVTYHDHQFICLLEYWKTGEAEHLSGNLRLGDTGQRMIMEEPDAVRNQWNRLHMLYKALSLLGIHPNFQMTKQYPPTTRIEQAKEVLKEVRRSFDGIEIRRRMIYLLCMARANERSDTHLAITYIEEAIKLSSDRTTFYATETSHLREYLEKMKWLHIQREAFGWLSNICSMSDGRCALVFIIIAYLCWVLFSWCQ